MPDSRKDLPSPFSSWRKLLGIMDESESGVIFLESDSDLLGSIAVDQGRLCWVSEGGRRDGLGSKREPTSSSSAILRVISSSVATIGRKAVNDRKPRLVVPGPRDALKEHCVEALLRLHAANPSSPRWSPRPALATEQGIPIVEVLRGVAERYSKARVSAVDHELIRDGAPDRRLTLGTLGDGPAKLTSTLGDGYA